MTVDKEKLIAALSLSEKISLLAGADFWTTVPIERLGIPALKLSDGPNGVRGREFSMGPSAAALPVGIALAATWNVDMVRALGGLLAYEAKSKGAHVVLGPTINMHRSTLSGRNFECFSEDPYLASRLAVAYISGLQAAGVAACPKHFVANDSEFERYTMNSVVDERALRELYLAPFKAAVTEAKTWALMSGYNKLNGTWCSENPELLQDILRDEWGFDGLVVSDWFGTFSSAIGRGGLDLEMPGPARWTASLEAEVSSGRLEERLVDDKLRRLFTLLERTGRFDTPELQEETSDDRAEHRQLLRQAASEAIVLLKNEQQLLPLDPAELKSIAVIGAAARWPGVMGGGSAVVPAHYQVTPLEAIREAVPEGVNVNYAWGAANYRMVPLMDTRQLETEAAETGFELLLFNAAQPAGEAVVRLNSDRPLMSFIGQVHPLIPDPANFSLRLRSTFQADETGVHRFSLVSSGLGRMMLDGELVIDNWDDHQPGVNLFAMEAGEKTVDVALMAGQRVELIVDYASAGQALMNLIRLGCQPPIADDPLAAAVQAAAAADVAVVFVGTNQEWESEGDDQASMELPGDQNALVEAVAAVNDRTVVVLNSGSPKTLPWLEQVDSLIAMWFLGQEAGHAVADILFGHSNPSGHLPQTFPKQLEDTPAFLNYPGENGEVRYGEGLFIGYRYYQHKGIAPLFPFGHGLSYTHFSYDNLQLETSTVNAGEHLTLTFTLSNQGDRAGQEVVQLYIHDPSSRLVRPEQELKAFKKVYLKPGESQLVSFSLSEEALAYYDPSLADWIAESGRFELSLGRSCTDIRLQACFDFVHPLDQPPPVDAAQTFHVDLPLAQLLGQPESQDVLTKHLGELTRAPTMLFAMDMSLRDFVNAKPHLVHPRLLSLINTELAELVKD